MCVATEDMQKGKWILDSGCTFHMSPYKGYFSDYQDFDGGRVMMGNNSVCKVIGISKIYLKLHDGSRSIKEIRQVRHFQNLKGI